MQRFESTCSSQPVRLKRVTNGGRSLSRSGCRRTWMLDQGIHHGPVGGSPAGPVAAGRRGERVAPRWGFEQFERPDATGGELVGIEDTLDRPLSAVEIDDQLKLC